MRAYRVADNQLVLAGAWDEELLAAELHALNAAGFDLDLTGFDQEELDRLLAPLDERRQASPAKTSFPSRR